MPLPLAVAARAAGAATNAGATALGLGMGKSDLDLTRELFKLQMRQSKRLWAADWAEQSVRHAEACMQAAQQHAESQAMAMASYYQSEKLASQAIKLTRDQDSRNYEMAWRAEVRESLRDELVNQYNRFNIVMLCDTVCLGCVFALVAEGQLPDNSPHVVVSLYVAAMGISITLFSVSLWFAVIVIRRLHEHTAAILERKLFMQSEDLQKEWHHQLSYNLPTGPSAMYLMHQAYGKWVQQHLRPIGDRSIHLMTFGVIAMFFTAGLLTQERYSIEYTTVNAGYFFWSMVVVTSVTVLGMKFSEDRRERRKEGVYDNSWQDHGNPEDAGPFAKITRVGRELFSGKAVELANTDRLDSLSTQEQMQRGLCSDTELLRSRVVSMRKESEQRAKTRTEIMQLLTTAAEELDALPEELIARLNKLLHDIDEADRTTADLVTIHEESDNSLRIDGSIRSGWSRFPLSRDSTTPMASFPMDAQRIPVSLGSLRRSLGQARLSTLLRIENLSNEPLRLKSGIQLREGRYFTSLNSTDPNNHSVCYHLYPSTEIPPKSEIVIAARNNGTWIIPSSNVMGEVVYTNKDESWLFRIKFANQLMQNHRSCRVKAEYIDQDGEETDQFWSIEKKELDIKANNEILVTINAVGGERGRKAVMRQLRSQRSLLHGYLQKNMHLGLGLKWHQRWVNLSPTAVTCSSSPTSMKTERIALKDILSVGPSPDLVMNNVFEIRTKVSESATHKFSAATPEEREAWIKAINECLGAGLTSTRNFGSFSGDESATSSESKQQSVVEGGFECVHDHTDSFSIVPAHPSIASETLVSTDTV
jgi:hypothetical protein